MSLEASARESLRLATIQYLAGTADYLQVIVSQTTHLSASREVISARLRLVGHRIQLAAALGGSWTDEALARARSSPIAGTATTSSRVFQSVASRCIWRRWACCWAGRPGCGSCLPSGNRRPGRIPARRGCPWRSRLPNGSTGGWSSGVTGRCNRATRSRWSRRSRAASCGFIRSWEPARSSTRVKSSRASIRRTSSLRFGRPRPRWLRRRSRKRRRRRRRGRGRRRR